MNRVAQQEGSNVDRTLIRTLFTLAQFFLISTILSGCIVPHPSRPQIVELGVALSPAEQQAILAISNRLVSEYPAVLQSRLRKKPLTLFLQEPAIRLIERTCKAHALAEHVLREPTWATDFTLYLRAHPDFNENPLSVAGVSEDSWTPAAEADFQLKFHVMLSYLIAREMAARLDAEGAFPRPESTGWAARDPEAAPDVLALAVSGASDSNIWTGAAAYFWHALISQQTLLGSSRERFYRRAIAVADFGLDQVDTQFPTAPNLESLRRDLRTVLYLARRMNEDFSYLERLDRDSAAIQKSDLFRGDVPAPWIDQCADSLIRKAPIEMTTTVVARALVRCQRASTLGDENAKRAMETALKDANGRPLYDWLRAKSNAAPPDFLVLNERAEVAMALGEVSDAQACLSAMRSQKPSQRILLFAQAQLHWHQREPKLAEELLKQAVEKVDPVLDASWFLRAYEMLANIADARGDRTACLEYLNTALGLLEDGGTLGDIAQVSWHLARKYTEMGAHRRALRYYLKAARFIDDEGFDSDLCAMFLIDFANYYIANKQYAEASSLANDAARRAEKLKNFEIQAWALSFVCMAEALAGNHETATKCWRDSEKLIRTYLTADAVTDFEKHIMVLVKPTTAPTSSPRETR